MTGYLVPISKAKLSQDDFQRGAKQALDRAGGKIKGVVVKQPPASPAVPPGTPANKISRQTMTLASPKVLVGGGALLVTGAGGAYMYRRKRVEKSLSLMQPDFASVMMRTP